MGKKLTGSEKVAAFKKRLAEGGYTGKPGKVKVLSRPDPITGKRTDITVESMRHKRPDLDIVHISSAPIVSGKEYVFEFSGPIGSAAAKYISQLSKSLGGKRAYIEDQNKLVVVL